jgi:hypothetical protein
MLVQPFNQPFFSAFCHAFLWRIALWNRSAQAGAGLRLGSGLVEPFDAFIGQIGDDASKILSPR